MDRANFFPFSSLDLVRTPWYLHVHLEVNSLALHSP